MKTAFLQLLGWTWIALVLYLFIALSPRVRPTGVLGELIKSFFDAMTAAYLQ